MRFALLGPLDVLTGCGRSPVSAAKPRLLLTTLLISDGHAASAERLADEVWQGEPPPSAAGLIRRYVMELRRMIGDGVLATRAPGYALRLRPGDLDTDRADELTTAGRRALSQGDPATADALFTRALGVWRGPALADVPRTPLVCAEVACLEERRLALEEAHAETGLLLGRHDELVPELSALAEAHPLRETAWCRLMTALYRSGRRAEALDAYQRAYRAIRDELGIEPCTPLRHLHARILRADPTLDPPRVPTIVGT